jgi:hypothetical protein
MFTNGGGRDLSILEEREVIIRRACRLRAYVGALYGALLEGSHTFNETAARHVMIKDFDTATQVRIRVRVKVRVR